MNWLTGHLQSKSFRNPHQIIGIIVLILVLGQFILGFTHHRIYKRTQEPTKLAPIHVWLGRLVIFLGILNGFLYALLFYFLTRSLDRTRY